MPKSKSGSENCIASISFSFAGTPRPYDTLRTISTLSNRLYQKTCQNARVGEQIIEMGDIRKIKFINYNCLSASQSSCGEIYAKVGDYAVVDDAFA